jgi:sRNA-binding regulator protein Hfq
MPYIDVSSILLDPEIAGEKFQVIRRKETINPFGESVLASQTYNVIGQIGPTARNSLIREQSFSSQEKTIRVITSFKLVGAAKDGLQQDYQPDLIFWKNGYYLAGEIEDYSQYGAGLVSADCSVYDWTIPIIGGPTGANFGFKFYANYNSANIPLCS